MPRWRSGFFIDTADLLRYLVLTLEGLGIPYVLVGSVASMAYGEPRGTLDIDVVMEIAPDAVPALAARFPEPDFHFDDVAIAEAVRERLPFNIIHVPSGMKIDVFLPADALERIQIARGRRLVALPDLEASFAAPEDVILKKLVYHHEGGSDKHLRDIAAMLRLSGDQIDRPFVTEWAARLGVADAWAALNEAEGA